MKYGHYSAKAAARIGTVVWLDPNGREVICTNVGPTKALPDGYWPDGVEVGEVVEFVRVDAAWADRVRQDRWAFSRP